ncbi:MAG: hypothetical protein OXG81_03615 [Acidobacteria bacterium]|nr:hypothetical protein [Acidobacteriota bacterium]
MSLCGADLFGRRTSFALAVISPRGANLRLRAERRRTAFGRRQ